MRACGWGDHYREMHGPHPMCAKPRPKLHSLCDQSLLFTQKGEGKFDRVRLWSGVFMIF